MAISPALNQMHVLVHPEHADRNWEDPSDTIWACDLDTHEKVGELKTDPRLAAEFFISAQFRDPR